MWRLKVGGLALATSISGIFNFAMLFYLLDKRIGRFDRGRIFGATAKIIVSSVIMGFFCRWAFENLTFSFMQAKVLREIARLFTTIAFSAGVFTLFAYLTGVEQIKALAAWILNRK